MFMQYTKSNLLFHSFFSEQSRFLNLLKKVLFNHVRLSCQVSEIFHMKLLSNPEWRYNRIAQQNLAM